MLKENNQSDWLAVQGSRGFGLRSCVAAILLCAIGSAAYAAEPKSAPATQAVEAPEPGSETALNDRIGRLEAQLRLLADSGSSDGKKVEAFLRDPAQVLDLAQAYIDSEKFEDAYYLLRGIHLLDPEVEPETELKACRYAASIAGILYRRERFHAPKGPWVLTEPEASFQWLCELDDVPEEAYREMLRVVFAGVPIAYWKRFMAFRETHFPDKAPVPTGAEEDNGRVERILFDG